jgi:hypothetical protein
MRAAHGGFGIQDDQKDPGVLALPWGFTMLHEHIAREADNVIGMVRNIRHDHAGLAPSLIDPVLAGAFPRAGFAKGKGHAHRRPFRGLTGWLCSRLSSHSSTLVRR